MIPRLLSALLPPSYWALLPGHLWLSAVQLPQFWSITPQHIYDLNEPTSFLLSINNWKATEGGFFFFFSTAIWRGRRVAEFTQQVKNARRKAPADWIQLLLKVGGGGRRRGEFTRVLFCRLFRASALSLIRSNLFGAAHDIQTQWIHGLSRFHPILIFTSFTPTGMHLSTINNRSRPGVALDER